MSLKRRNTWRYAGVKRRSSPNELLQNAETAKAFRGPGPARKKKMLYR